MSKYLLIFISGKGGSLAKVGYTGPLTMVVAIVSGGGVCPGETLIDCTEIQNL